MNIIDWMNMNMIADIAFLVFSAAIVWKFRKLENKLALLKSDVELTMRNPQAAKRLLKERK